MRTAPTHTMYLSVLLGNIQNRKRVSTRLTQLFELLAHYELWDQWITHPYCFLLREEVDIILHYLHHGRVKPMVAILGTTEAQINTILNRAIAKLNAGKEDYNKVAAYLKLRTPVWDWDAVTLILNRPFILFGFSSRLLHRLLRSGYESFYQIEEQVGIAVFMDQLHGLGDSGYAEVRQHLERYDLHGLLRQHEVGIEYAYLNIPGHPHTDQHGME